MRVPGIAAAAIAIGWTGAVYAVDSGTVAIKEPTAREKQSRGRTPKEKNFKQKDFKDKNSKDKDSKDKDSKDEDSKKKKSKDKEKKAKACTDWQDFFVSDCQIALYRIRVYGTIDIGFGYQTRGAPFNDNYAAGVAYFIQRMNRMAMWTLAPNASSQSSIGVDINEKLSAGWSFIAKLEAGYDPYSLLFANSPRSVASNIGVPLNQQTTNVDSSRAGQFYNAFGYFGLSNDSYGTLTVFRQNSLMLDAVTTYDPMSGAYAFSPIAFSGIVSGGGDTEDARYSTSVKYRVTIAGLRLAALYQFGGYDLNNGSNGAFEGQLGGDVHLGPGTLSLEGIAGYNRDAVNLVLLPTAVNPAVMTATLSDNTNVMALAKYTIDRLKLYTGYEWMQFAAPSDPITAGGFNNIAGDFVCISCASFNGTDINNTAYSAKDRILQAFWFGARYSLTDEVDVAAAYYHYDQNNYATAASTLASCARSAASSSQCHGRMDAASAMIDWKFAPKWDTYIGTMFSQQTGGLNNGYLSRNNLATTAGLRFRF
jgi:predicted porin